MAVYGFVQPASERQHCTRRQWGVGNRRAEQSRWSCLSYSLIPILPVLDTTNWYEPAVCVCRSEANRTLGCIKRGANSRAREGIVSLNYTLIKPHLESCVQAWGSQEKKKTKGCSMSLKEAMRVLWQTKGVSMDKPQGRPHCSLPAPKGSL